MNALAQISVTRAGTSWLVTCHSCGFERMCARRPGADGVAHDHRKTCRPKEAA